MEENDHSSHIVKGDPKVVRAWVMYDWANSVYQLTISSTIFPHLLQFGNPPWD